MKYLNFIVSALLVVVYLIARIPPSERFNLWVVSFIIPIALVINILMVLVALWMRKKSALFLFIPLIFGGEYLVSTIGLKAFFRSEPKAADVVTVLNYNLSGFNTGYYTGMDSAGWQRADSLQKGMIGWVLNSGADIQCYQEFPHNPSAGFDLLRAFERNGYSHYYSATKKRGDPWLFGILIVSRLPIVGKGDLMASSNGYNRIAFVDVVRGADTLRVINVHLESMQMKAFHPGYSENFEDQKRNAKIVFWRLRSGVFERSKQIAGLVNFIESSPYPVICAGDYNEMPYSYSYRMLRRTLKNSFEESGRGFGFTYNGNTLNMLRIDNQFYSGELQSVWFETLDTVRYTDHFPIRGAYTWTSP